MTSFAPYTQKIMKPMIKVLAKKLLPDYHVASLKGYSQYGYFIANVTTPSKKYYKNVIITCDHYLEGMQFKLMLAKDGEQPEFLCMSINLNDFYRLAHYISKDEREKMAEFMDTFKEPIIDYDKNNFVRIGQNKNC